MFWNKEYTTKEDKIIDNETGAELDINTNNLADKSGIKSDLGQGESPIEVEVTPKKDVKEKFAKGFKKALMVGTVTLFTVGLIYGGSQVKDVYDDYSQYYKKYSAEPESYTVSEDYAKYHYYGYGYYGPNYYTYDDGDYNLVRPDDPNSYSVRAESYGYNILASMVSAKYQEKLLENDLTFDYSKIDEIRNIQKSESFADLPDGRENVIRDIERLYVILYKYENLKEKLFENYDKTFKSDNDDNSFYDYYMAKLDDVCGIPWEIYDMNPIEVKQTQIKINKIKNEISDVSGKIDLYEKENGIGLEDKLDYEVRKCDELFEEAISEVEKEQNVKINYKYRNFESLEEYQQNVKKLEEIKKDENIKNVEYCGDGEFLVEFKDKKHEDMER